MKKHAVSPARRASKRVDVTLTSSARLLACLAVVATFAACRDSAAVPKAQVAQQGSSSTTAPEVVATIGNDKITMADVRDRSGTLLDQLDAQYQQTRDKLIGAALDSIVRERLLADEAKKQGKTPADLVAAAVTAAGEPSDLEIAAWFHDNQERIGGRPIEQVSSQIATLLRNQRRAEASDKLEQRLRAEQKVAMVFEPHRLQFANAGAPTKGKKGAPVTLVEFSDFQCPFCRSAAPSLRQVEQKFGDKVQIVYRQFPIPSIHQYATKAAEASLCANEQGKFWDLHDAMFQDQTKLAVGDLKATARRLGMDAKKFDSCLDSGRYVEQVQNDQKEGRQIGVNGTPAMYINGVYVEGGAVPFSVLAAKIEKELDRKTQ
jgi:protein-disulfide isomerase